MDHPLVAATRTQDVVPRGPGSGDSWQRAGETTATGRPGVGAYRDPPPAFPGYEIRAEVGRGGIGVVYEARDLRLNQVVAIKMIRSGADASPMDFARFRTEAEASRPAN